MNASTDSKDTIKFWTFLLMMLLGVAVAVTLIDLTIKASILAESNSLKLAMEEWEVRNGPKQAGRIDKRDRDNASHNGSFSGDVLATGDAGLEAGSANNGSEKPVRPRTGNRNKPSASDGN